MKIKVAFAFLMTFSFTYPFLDRAGDEVVEIFMSPEIVHLANYVIKRVDRMATENCWPENGLEAQKRKIRCALFSAMCNIRNARVRKAQKSVKSKL